MKKFSDPVIDVKEPGMYSYELGQRTFAANGMHDFETEVQYIFDDSGKLIEFNVPENYSKEEAAEVQEEVRKRLTLKHFNIVFRIIKKMINDEEDLKFLISKIDEHVVQFTFEGIDEVQGFLSLKEGFLFKAGGVMFEIRNIKRFCSKLEDELAKHPKVRLKAMFL